jgi:GNAT superfamily N-acetyltransferase
MNVILDKDINKSIEEAMAFCEEEGLDIVFTHELSDELLQIISERTRDNASMYFASIDMLKLRLLNGCYIVKKNDEVYGHIFVHKHMVHKFAVYERSSLWVHPLYRKANIGLLLMNLMTKRYVKDFLISIAQESAVHHNNQLLGMKHIALKELSPRIVEALEKIGKLRDELKYKYYVNSYFESKLGTINKILNQINNQ